METSQSNLTETVGAGAIPEVVVTQVRMFENAQNTNMQGFCVIVALLEVPFLIFTFFCRVAYNLPTCKIPISLCFAQDSCLRLDKTVSAERGIPLHGNLL